MTAKARRGHWDPSKDSVEGTGGSFQRDGPGFVAPRRSEKGQRL